MDVGFSQTLANGLRLQLCPQELCSTRELNRCDRHPYRLFHFSRLLLLQECVRDDWATQGAGETLRTTPRTKEINARGRRLRNSVEEP